MMNIFALAAESKITGKLEEWVIIDQDCFKVKSPSLKLMAASAES